MKYFDRVCRITVSPDISVENYRITFEVKKSILSNINSCKVNIYNLTQTVRNRITSDSYSLIRVEAGYRQNTGLVLIGEGNISNVTHSFALPEVITTIYSKDGFKSITNNPISLSFIGKTKLNSVISAIIAKLNIPIRYVDYNRDMEFKNGFSYVGSIPNVLDKLGLQFGFIWSIQNGQLLILNGDKPTGNNDVFLSYETGLIETPELIIKNKDVSKINKSEYKVTSLLQPQMEVGDLVKIASKTINGNFLVNELTHVGDNMGNNWLTTMVVVNYG